jgi:uncharacterized protein YjbI with pentapeptide repeats
MVIVDRLLAGQGDAREILALPKTGEVDWSCPAELSRFKVIRGVQFERFSLSRAEVGLNFVECGFKQCAFRDLKTDGHFWGAEDRWTECVFERCDLRRMIAPVNSFVRCRFEGVTVVSFKPHQTLFEGCSFSRGTIQGLKAHLISNSLIANPDLKGEGGQLLFRDCRFEGMSFRQCYFEGVVFRRCGFENTTASGCSFGGVVSDVTWWGTQVGDPFTVFLTKALDLIRAKCGPDSAAYREFETYVIDYGSGKTRDKDFSACLYNNRVPYSETKLVFNDLRELVDSFSF